MQISDGSEYLSQFYQPGSEIVGYDDLDEAIASADYYLTHARECQDIVRNGFTATMERHRFRHRVCELEALLHNAIASAR